MRATAGLIITVAVVLGPPAAVLWWWDQAALSWPSRMRLAGWVADPPGEAIIVVFVGILAAVLWLAVAVTACLTTTRRLRHTWQRLKQVPLPTPAQATATSMAGAAMFGVPATTVQTAAIDVVPGLPDQPMPSALHRVAAGDAGNGDQRAGYEGVELPDGSWLPPETAQAVTVAAAIGWLRRRRDYRPLSSSEQGAGDTPQVSPTVAAVQAQVPADTGSGVGVGVLGRHAGAPLLPQQLPATGVGLTGEGAADAARGVLVTALLSPITLQVVTTRADADRLLGATASAMPALPSVYIAEDLHTALTYIAEARTTGSGTSRVLMTTAPQDRDDAHRLHTALGQGQWTAVLLGHWPLGVTRQIEPDGTTTTDTGAQRWCVLSARTATDLCLLAGHANGVPAAPPARPSAGHAVVGSPRIRPGGDTLSPELVLTVFGPPELTFRGTPIHLRRAAAVQALVLLAVHRDGLTTRRLGETLWPAERPHATTSRVYTTISELRRTLTTHTGTPVVHRDDDRYHLDPRYIDVDLWRLQQAAARLTDPATRGEDHAAACQRIIELHSGDLAAGRTWPWLEPHRERLRRDILDAHLLLADRADAPADKLTILERALQADPHNEEALLRTATTLAEIGEYRRIHDLTTAHRLRLAQSGLASSPQFDASVAALTAARQP